MLKSNSRNKLNKLNTNFKYYFVKQILIFSQQKLILNKN